MANMTTFTFEGWYSDDPEESGSRTDIVIAPDQPTAERLAARQVLEDNGWSLEDRGYDTLAEFYENEITHNTVLDLDGTACPNCTSHGGQQADDLDSQLAQNAMGRPIMVCNTCGYRWANIGFGEKRRELEAEAKEEIKDLDRFERHSAGKACRTDGCSGDTDDGEGWDGYCGNCADAMETEVEDGDESE